MVARTPDGSRARTYAGVGRLLLAVAFLSPTTNGALEA
jgi:hypothetical protein